MLYTLSFVQMCVPWIPQEDRDNPFTIMIARQGDVLRSLRAIPPQERHVVNHGLPAAFCSTWVPVQDAHRFLEACGCRAHAVTCECNFNPRLHVQGGEGAHNIHNESTPERVRSPWIQGSFCILQLDTTKVASREYITISYSFVGHESGDLKILTLISRAFRVTNRWLTLCTSSKRYVVEVKDLMTRQTSHRSR